MAKNYVRIGDTIGAWIDKNNELVNKVGDLALLQTSATADSCIVFAVNELHADHLLDSARLDSAETRLDGVDSNLDSDMGTRLSLQTNDKTDLVSAINEINTLATYFAVFQDSDLVIGKEQDTKIVIADSSVTVEGNLRIRGTVYDNERFTDAYLVVNEGVTGSPTLNAGIENERGSETNAMLTWDETLDAWTAGLQGSEKVIAIQDSNATLGTFLPQSTKHNRFVLGDSNVSSFHIPGINNFLATNTSTLNIYASDGVTVLKTIIGFS